MDKELNKKLDKSFNEMCDIIDGTDLENIRSNGVSVRVGSKIYNLVLSEEQDNTNIEDIIRNEFSKKVSDQMKKVKEILKNKREESSIMISSFMEEYERKEKALKDLLKNSSPMPEVTWEYAKRGLSIVKGYEKGDLIWLVKRKYNPKFVDRFSIDPLYVKKLLTNIYIAIHTTDNSVTRISTHYIHNLEHFDHYHQNHPDCWGNWQWPRSWKTPEDILKIADDAESILENINTMSIARRNPSLLPRLDTLRNHITKTPMNVDIKLSATALREGMGDIDNDNIWGN